MGKTDRPATPTRLVLTFAPERTVEMAPGFGVAENPVRAGRKWVYDLRVEDDEFSGASAKVGTGLNQKQRAPGRAKSRFGHLSSLFCFNSLNVL